MGKYKYYERVSGNQVVYKTWIIENDKVRYDYINLVSNMLHINTETSKSELEALLDEKVITEISEQEWNTCKVLYG